MEYYRLTHTAGLLSAVFMTGDVTQARGPPINNLHPLSDISTEKRYHLAKRPPLERVCCYQKYANESALLSTAPNGINEGNQR